LLTVPTQTEIYIKTSLTNWSIPSTVIVRQTSSVLWPDISQTSCLRRKACWSIGLLLLRSNAVNSSRPCGGEKYRPGIGIELAFDRRMAYLCVLQLRNSRNTPCFNKLLSGRSMEGEMQSFSKLLRLPSSQPLAKRLWTRRTRCKILAPHNWRK